MVNAGRRIGVGDGVISNAGVEVHKISQGALWNGAEICFHPEHYC